MIFYLGIGWLAVLLGVIIVHAARSHSTAARILALDLLTLVLIGLLALSAGDDRRSFALDAALGLALLSFVATLAACRFHEDRRPFS